MNTNEFVDTNKNGEVTILEEIDNEYVDKEFVTGLERELSCDRIFDIDDFGYFNF